MACEGDVARSIGGGKHLYVCTITGVNFRLVAMNFEPLCLKLFTDLLDSMRLFGS